MGHSDNVEHPSLSTAQFTIIVAEEFAIVSLVTIVSAIWELHYLFVGFVTKFLLHLIVHVVQFILWRAYIPGIMPAI